MLDPKVHDAAFAAISAEFVAALGDNGVIATDSSSFEGVHEEGISSAPDMMVSAYATDLRLTLATVAAVHAHSGDRSEVGAALDVLGRVDFKG